MWTWRLIIALASLTGAAHSQTRIDAISTQFRWLGPNDKIVVERYDDPKVRNVSCYMSRADTGGIRGGWAWQKTPAAFLLPAAR
jgi:CreA protein